MLSDIVKPGDKVEVTLADSSENIEKNEKIKTYFSKIYDIMEEDKLKIAMPVDGTKLFVLDFEQKYELCIFTSYGMFKCGVKLVERYKEENLFVAVVELYTALQKFQRRRYYRLQCNIELQYRILTEKETHLLLNEKIPAEYHYSLISKGQIQGITLDISGGGIRFISEVENAKGSHMLIEFNVPIGNEMKYFSVVAVQVDSKKLPNREHTYEHRVQFENITKKEREDLIKFIFEEERRFRKNEKG